MSRCYRWKGWLGAALLLSGCLGTWAGSAERPARVESWAETVTAIRQQMTGKGEEAARAAWQGMKRDFPVEWDWALQDAGEGAWRWLLPSNRVEPGEEILRKVASECGPNAEGLGGDLGRDDVVGRLARYARLCEARRASRLQNLLAVAPKVVFVRQRTVLPSFFAYTEGQSDAQSERHFLPGAELCLLEWLDEKPRVTTLLADPRGAIRDPAVSWEGDRLVFAWKKELDADDYHLYEMDLKTRTPRAITSGLGFADYEPAWLPDGQIVFASTRCVQTVDCWWTEVSNLYVCDAEGRGLRRLTFDQVHAIFPQVLGDGRVIYTRWDYNDRGQVFPQPLFQMFADGTGQTEFYGNNSWFPTTIAHARGIPGTEKVLAILCGHHTAQMGQLAVIDPGLGRQENSGVQLVAPVRKTRAERIDAYGQEGPLWQYPYPIGERECVVAYAPLGWREPNPQHGAPDFGLYWMDFAGRRELLWWDPAIPCTQPVPLAPRPRPPVAPSRVDYAQERGTYYLQDIYAGDGLRGVPRGAIKKLRVVALEFRAAGVGNNGSSGPGGAALVSTPISIGNGSWDVKRVLGEATVHADGSAFFTVPARTPVYFQALDEEGLAVQTMRSWSTLQPAEVSGCVGCHEHKNSAPPAMEFGSYGMALSREPEAMAPLASETVGFSFPKQIQPILDRHCIGCHRDRGAIERLRHGQAPKPGEDGNAFSLLGEETVDVSAKRKWSDAYLVLTGARLDSAAESTGSWKGEPGGRVVNWVSSQSVPSLLEAKSAGAIRSGLMPLLAGGHQGVNLSQEELRRIACWIDLLVPYCGDYREANVWTEEEREKYDRYEGKRARMQALERENIRSWVTRAQPTE